MGDKRLKSINETKKNIERDNFSLNRKNCLYIITVSKTNSMPYNTKFLKIIGDWLNRIFPVIFDANIISMKF